MSDDFDAALAALAQGEPKSMQHLFALAYPELKRLAHSRLYSSNLQQRMATESLLHESFLRLVQQHSIVLPDRKHFFAYASRVMHRLILDMVREGRAQKRGAGEKELTLDTDLADLHADAGDAERVSDAMADLERVSPNLARLVEMRFFGGLTELELADALGISERTVRREWDKARSVLLVLLER
jgi:RNA polymerase sigma factor (TIGR02999 family)